MWSDPRRLNRLSRYGALDEPTGFSTKAKRPEAPVKSRFHSAWPGSLSSAG